jgi:sensor domain DACNV-containing protein
MAVSTYPDSRLVAATVQKRFARHIAAARQKGQQDLASQPDALSIEAIINVAFWASLRREESYFPKISFALLPPEQAGQPLTFERLLPFTPFTLARLAPAVERPGIHLGVWRYGDELCVWGAAHRIPRLCFVLEVIEPGLLVIKYPRGQEFSKFVNVAALKGDQIKIVDEESASLPDCPTLIGSLLGSGSRSSSSDSFDAFVQLAVSMRAHGRGGALLVVPEGSELWRESILWPVPYSVTPPFSELAELMRLGASVRSERPWQEALGRAVDVVAGLTAVDGATLINDQYELLAFGAKIGTREGGAQVEQVLMTEPVVGAAALVVNPAHLGGTRHLSAAQFAQDQRDSLALVASQDGRFTVFAWAPCEEMVHAHRVETLLL